MKSTVAIIILVVTCLALGVALVSIQRKRAIEKEESKIQIDSQLAELQKTHKDLEEQKQVNMTLEGDIKTRAEDLKSLSNDLSKVMADLEKSDAQAKAIAEQLRTAQAELARKDQKINELEGQRTALGRQMDQLTNSIDTLEKQISATEKKLATTQGEKEFLVTELTRLRAEKAELERQFNDLAVLKAQVSKLKEEMAISRRLEFIRLNLFGAHKGGAGKLMPAPRPALASATNYDLAVEVRQGGSARIVAPTNAPATNVIRSTNPPLRDAPAAPPK